MNPPTVVDGGAPETAAAPPPSPWRVPRQPRG